jgi:hypothetical protein
MAVKENFLSSISRKMKLFRLYIPVFNADFVKNFISGPKVEKLQEGRNNYNGKLHNLLFSKISLGLANQDELGYMIRFIRKFSQKPE